MSKTEDCVECSLKLQLRCIFIKRVGVAWRAYTPTGVGGDAKRRIIFPATAIDKTANGDMLLDSEQQKTKMKSANRCMWMNVNMDFSQLVRRDYFRF